MWSTTGDTHSSTLGDYRLKVRLESDTVMLAEDGDLGSEEHPFVWHFEVEHVVEGFICRGLRETLTEAKYGAQRKAEEYLPDAVPLAEGF